MRTGVSYMGHHNPRHIETDVREMRRLGLDDVLLAAQENDFAHFTGKLHFTPQIAREYGLRPIAIFWGALNLFGGGRSSQFLLEHPEGFQVGRDGSCRPAGCYVNPVCVARIKEMIDTIAERGFEGYFVDEPTPLRDCFCRSCRERFASWYQRDLVTAPAEMQEEFRQRCVIDYVRTIADYCKAAHPELETMCCIMPCDRDMWPTALARTSTGSTTTGMWRRWFPFSATWMLSARGRERHTMSGFNAGGCARARRIAYWSKAGSSSMHAQMRYTFGHGRGRSAPRKPATTRAMRGRRRVRSWLWRKVREVRL